MIANLIKHETSSPVPSWNRGLNAAFQIQKVDIEPSMRLQASISACNPQLQDSMKRSMGEQGVSCAYSSRPGICTGPINALPSDSSATGSPCCLLRQVLAT